jgi:hypothetical protein
VIENLDVCLTSQRIRIRQRVPGIRRGKDRMGVCDHISGSESRCPRRGPMLSTALIGFLMAYLPWTADAQSCTPLPQVLPVTARMGIPNTDTDPSGRVGGLAVRGPVPITVTTSGQRDSMSVMVGAKIEVTIIASWLGSYTAQNLTLFAYEEPGIPNGGVLSAPGCAGRCNPTNRTFTWTPVKGQEGIVHTMCFMAVPVTASLAACVSQYRCVDFDVKAPEVAFEAVTPSNGVQMHSAVGCDLDICFQAKDMLGIYETDIQRKFVCVCVCGWAWICACTHILCLCVRARTLHAYTRVCRHRGKRLDAFFPACACVHVYMCVYVYHGFRVFNIFCICFCFGCMHHTHTYTGV